MGLGGTRLVAGEDAPVLAELLRLNREFMTPWEPSRDDSYFTADGQHALIRNALREHDRGVMLPHVILNGAGHVVGRVTLYNIERSAFQSCRLGYWLSLAENGHGLATGAVRQIKNVAFADLALHRIEAGTLLANVRSQRVLQRNGFQPIGLASAYLQIAGRWQDHMLYQVIAPTAPDRS
jgi:ribosomal-protein-alanine N-acetyltransferase